MALATPVCFANQKRFQGQAMYIMSAREEILSCVGDDCQTVDVHNARLKQLCRTSFEISNFLAAAEHTSC